MQLDINNKVIDIKFGFKFAEKMNEKYYQEDESGIKAGIGIEAAYSYLRTGDYTKLVEVIEAGQLSSQVKATKNEIIDFLDNCEDLEQLANDFLELLLTSGFSKKKATEAKTRIEQGEKLQKAMMEAMANAQSKK